MPTYRMFGTVLLGVLTGPLPAQKTQERTHAPLPTTAAISAEDLRTRLYIVADDSMEGREPGRRGGARVEAYLAAEARRLGLEPAGENGTYFQKIPLFSRKPDPANSLQSAGGALAQFTDFVLMPHLGTQTFLGGQPFGGSFEGRDVPTVYGGRIGDAAMITPEQATGRFVIFAPPIDGRGRVVTSFWQRDNLVRYGRARGLGIASIDSGYPRSLRTPRDAYEDSTRSAAKLTVVLLTTPAAERILGAPLATAHAGDAGKPVSGTARWIDTPFEYPPRNVVAVLRGSDPVLRNEYVAIGAHSDHVGILPTALDHDSVRVFNAVARPHGGDDPLRTPTDAEWVRIHAMLDSVRRLWPPRADSIQNGADDDGSGTVLALEIAEALAKGGTRPRRSVLFVWHTAEEKGLLGSEYYSDHPTVPRDSIVAQLNMDQMGRGGKEDGTPGDSNELLLIGSRRLSTELGDLVERVNGAPAYRFKLNYDFDKDGDPTIAYCRSDHYMYARYGIPVTFFAAAAWYRDYHMVSDEPQYIDYDRMGRIGNYILDVLRQVTEMDHRPVVDKPKPDPTGTCRQ
jgi:hypothetical protein